MPNDESVTVDPALEGFSRCHVGIIDHLDALVRLAEASPAQPEAGKVASETLRFFRDVITNHHRQEEKLLFTAMLSNSEPGEERDSVRGSVDRLTREHREVEALFKKIEPALATIAGGRPSELDVAVAGQLVTEYRAHASYEEEFVLPLAQTILARDSAEMAQLGWELHMRDPAIRSQLHFGRMT